jgi:hypothetical protein
MLLCQYAAPEGVGTADGGLTLEQGATHAQQGCTQSIILDLADEVRREGEFTDTKYVVTVRRELMVRVEAALRFAVDPSEAFIDRVARAIVSATAPTFTDFDTARDAARAAIEAIGL